MSLKVECDNKAVEIRCTLLVLDLLITINVSV